VHVAKRFEHLMLWHPRINNYEVLAMYAEAIERRGYGQKIWGFIDGTFMGFGRPQRMNQRLWYSGFYKGHGLKYQVIITPDGIISSLSPPFPGPRNDWFMTQRTGLILKLQQVMAGHERLYLYGDPAYSCSWGILAPYSHPDGFRYLSPGQRAFNQHLAKARIAVENGLGIIQNFFTRTAFAEAIQPCKQEPAAHYFASGFLTNLLTCLRANLVSDRFWCSPPDLWEYLCVPAPPPDERQVIIRSIQVAVGGI
jgi:hypothetical protein